MAGSIRPRPEKGRDAFELRIFLGRDARGRVRQKSKLFRGTRRAAEMELARLVTENVEEPAVVPQESARAFGPLTTINMAIQAWQDNGWQDLSPSCRGGTHPSGRRTSGVPIGRRVIADALGPYDVEIYLRAPPSKAGLSESSVRQTRAIPASRLSIGTEVEAGTRLARTLSLERRCRTGCSTSSPMRCGPRPSKEVLSLLAASKVTGGLACMASLPSLPPLACAARGVRTALETTSTSTGPRSPIDESVVAADGGALVKAPKSRGWAVRTVAIDLVTLSALSDSSTGGRLTSPSIGDFVVEGLTLRLCCLSFPVSSTAP